VTIEIPAVLQESLERWWERARELPALLEAHAALPASLREELPRVIAASEFVAAALLQDAALLSWLGVSAHGASANEEYERLVSRTASAPEAQRYLREWRRREMVRIAWADIAHRAEVTTTLVSVSDLADACLRAATCAAQLQMDPLFGRPRNADAAEVPLIVIAMGKLGGRELNFSSDIDLVFLYAEAGETDGPRSLDNSEYFNRLGRELIRLLDAVTEDGFVFRVDMRLRPFGDSGALVVSLAALDDYLQQHGRDWERYAWIKARAVVGERAFAAATRDFVGSFVYRRYLDFGVFDSLREMKALIAREVTRRELEHHLKLGLGGIRELEFVVQSMQLVRGGNDKRLQSTSLLEVLPLLAGSKLLSKAAVDRLFEAYLVLRKAENAVQMIRDQQSHVIPQDPADRARVALNMGLPDWTSAAARIDAARADVAHLFEALVFGGTLNRNARVCRI
jgi:glutamate-ammonia-ligase adenylyltransferase